MEQRLSQRRPYDAALADQVAEEAVGAFRVRHGELELAPVVVVIPALNEAECVGGVLDAIPAEACGLAVQTIVVDDGSTDDTSDVAQAHGAFVARLGQNLGQGAAFRVGYRLGREHGARYLVTLDADGQWDPADMAGVLAPVVEGEADFVLGSRVLGRAETDNRLRGLGVRVFGLLVTALTRVKVTDTSSGLRAMLAEVTARVPQHEPQYQSSELLLGAIYCGYRVAERPIVMHKRAAGESKKGHDVMFGVRYANVILRTWWRARRSAGQAASAATVPVEQVRG
jgi:glycosyltransferase involved in cell wall biosynthesis